MNESDVAFYKVWYIDVSSLGGPFYSDTVVHTYKRVQLKLDLPPAGQWCAVCDAEAGANVTWSLFIPVYFCERHNRTYRIVSA